MEGFVSAIKIDMISKKVLYILEFIFKGDDVTLPIHEKGPPDPLILTLPVLFYHCSSTTPFAAANSTQNFWVLGRM